MAAVSGVKTLRKVQLGRESTAGTAVAASTIWRGLALMPQDDRINERPEENVGLSSMTTRQYTPGLLASMAFPSTPATFGNIQHVLEAGIKTVTPVQDGAGTGYVNAYAMPSGDSNTTKTYTIEGGDNKIMEEMEYSFVVDFELTGKKNEAWMLTSNWQGRQGTVASFTGALSIPVAREMLFNKTKFYVDAIGGTIGTTQLTNSVIEASLKVTTGLKAQFTAEGNLYFSFMDFIGAKATMEWTMLHNATTAAQRVIAKANTPQLFQFNVLGTALTTPATETVERFTAGFAGVYSEFNAPNDEDEGSNIYKVSIECGYDTTAATFGTLTLVNQLSAVP